MCASLFESLSHLISVHWNLIPWSSWLQASLPWRLSRMLARKAILLSCTFEMGLTFSAGHLLKLIHGWNTCHTRFNRQQGPTQHSCWCQTRDLQSWGIGIGIRWWKDWSGEAPRWAISSDKNSHSILPLVTEATQKMWHSPIYLFFKLKLKIQYHDSRLCHFFKCVTHCCKVLAGGVYTTLWDKWMDVRHPYLHCNTVLSQFNWRACRPKVCKRLVNLLAGSCVVRVSATMSDVGQCCKVIRLSWDIVTK